MKAVAPTAVSRVACAAPTRLFTVTVQDTAYTDTDAVWIVIRV